MDIALPIVLHDNQQRIHSSVAKNIVVMSGKRFGKTDLALYKLIKSAFDRVGTYWYIAPTYGMAETIAWNRLIELLPKQLIKHLPIQNKLLIHLINGSTIQLKGADNVDSLRGRKLHGVILDECAYINPYLWNNIIRGQLLGVNGEAPGFALFISSPVNPLEAIGRKISDWYEKFYQEAMRKKQSGDLEWDAFHFTIYDNPLLSRDEINKIKEDSTDDSFNVEYLANPSAQSSQVYSEFNYGIHVNDKSPEAINFFVRGIDWGLDHPTVCLFAQVDVKNKMIFIEDEFVQSGFTVGDSCDVIKRKTGNRIVDWTVIDPSLKRRDPKTKIQELQEFINQGVPVIPGDNTARGYDVVKKLLKRNVLRIHPKCKVLIKQLKDLQWSDKTGDDTTDTLRYLCVRIHDTVPVFKLLAENTPEPQAKEASPFNFNNPYLFPRKEAEGITIREQVAYH